MKVLFISKEGDGISIPLQLAREGHDVKVWIKELDAPKIGKGLPYEMVKEWRPHVARSNLILCDMVGFSKLLPLFERYGKPTLGISEFADVIELDRQAGMDLFHTLKIGLPPTREYKSPVEAVNLLREWKNPAGYVVKPSGNLNTGLTMVCRDKKEYSWVLSLFHADQELVVQDIVEGVEISTEGWFNGNDWIHPFNHTFEEKRFLDGNLGPLTGCEGNVVIAMRQPNKLIESTLLKMTGLLRKISYRGPLDINCIVQKDQINALEFTPRFGFDAFEALMSGFLEPVGTFLFEVAVGTKKEVKIGTDYLMSVRLTEAPYPTKTKKLEREGMPVVGVTKENEKHIYLQDVYQDGELRYAGGGGIVCKVTGHGRTVREAKNRVYRTIEGLTINGVQYRTDIGDRVERDMAKLKEWGWL